uniref:ATP synthase subunit a n=1 Tax=Polyplax spinulosa TaxID=468197 RepID=V9PXK6_9NEOP|nr:ATP synthase subunit 6 [Polyplax spinulosa]
MMTIFDPSSFNSLVPLKWGSSVFFLVILSGGFWVVSTGFKLLVEMFLFNLCQGFKVMFLNWKQHSAMLIGLFYLILTMNVVGLLPFSFSVTAHLSWSLTICLPMWLGGAIYMFSKDSEGALAHFLPHSAPMGLAPFLVIVEMVSMLIRPLSLSVRLMANITAGHMILSLIETLIVSNSLSVKWFTLLMAGFLLFELGVALIQAYVLMNLLSLYWEENE